MVVDSEEMPVAFANVIFVNTSEGTTSNDKGLFYLKPSEDQDSAEFV